MLARLHQVCSSHNENISEIFFLVNKCIAMTCAENGRTLKRRKNDNDSCQSFLSLETCSPFVDGQDGRTPLHRACAPLVCEDEPEPVQEIEDHEISDLSSSDDDDDDDDDDDPSVTAIQVEEMGAREGPRRSVSPPGQLSWVLECVCILLGAIGQGLPTIQDRRGQTALHLLASHSPEKSYESLRLMIVHVLLRAASASNNRLIAIQDANSETALHVSLTRHHSLSNEGEEFDFTLVHADPEVLEVRNKNGMTPLHVACRFRSASLRLIKHMASVFPQAMHIQDYSGYTPLHYICEQAHPEWIQALLPRLSPKELLLKEKRRGFTPLHLACMDRAPLGVLEMLVKKSPESVKVKDGERCTPLHRLLSAHAHSLTSLQRFLKCKTDSPKLEGTNAEVWSKVLTLIPGVNIHNNYGLIHKVVEAGAPGIVLQLALKLHPEQAAIPDSEGLLPIHVAAMAPPVKCGIEGIMKRRRRIENAWRECMEEDDEETFDTRSTAEASSLSFESRHHNFATSAAERLEEGEQTTLVTHSVGESCGDSCSDCDGSRQLECVLSIYKEAACKKAPNGQLPIHRALSAGKTWTHGIGALVQSCPYTVEVRDPLSGLFPFALAAVDHKKEECGYKCKEPSMEAASIDNDESNKMFLLPDDLEDEDLTREHQNEQSLRELKQLDTVFILLSRHPELLLR